MTAVVATTPRPGADAGRVAVAATRAGAEVLTQLGTTGAGLTAAEADRRAATYGANAVRSHEARWPEVLLRQLRSPLLLLLTAAAIASFFLGEGTDAVIIVGILALSVGLGFWNEYRAEVAAEALHSRIRHDATVLRDGKPARVDVTALVPGDVVELRLGEVVPADIRLLDVVGLECDETVLTGESLPVAKSVEPVAAGSTLAELSSCALMGTIVRAGSGRGVVVATGGAAEFGRIALGLGSRQPDTEFQVGLRQFSRLLVVVAAALTTFVFAANMVLGRPLIDALLFSLAIAVGITPQLLPAVVSTSLAAGSHQLARRKVLVKRLVCIEDLGDVQVLLTDKTGTLTEGRLSFMRAIGPNGAATDEPLRLGLLCNDATERGAQTYAGADPLDAALWQSPAAAAAIDGLRDVERIAVLPFDHDRRMVSVLLRPPSGEHVLVTKGAPETVLARCRAVPDTATAALAAEFDAGSRVVAVARRPMPRAVTVTAADEAGLDLVGFLVFLDAPKRSAASAIARLRDLGIEVKVITGDNAAVAQHVCEQLGLHVRGVLTGADLDRLDDAALTAALPHTNVFARVSPEHKARIVRAQRGHGLDVAFVGDGVNDAVALHAADVGVSVDTATDVAKDAADIVLLEKDLGVLADGVVEGRRIFANTIKYVLMGTSSNFGNMFSAAAASAVLPFLPMLPSQVLLNNLLYDASQLTIPTDTVDVEQLHRPAHWDIAMIRRYMLFFGPLSSVFDFATFAVMLWVFDAGATLFRTAWFVESLATQTLVIFVIRTRRTPFFRSHPSAPLLTAAGLVVLTGAVLPYTPLAHPLGFTPLAGRLVAVLLLMVVAYLALVETAKHRFFRPAPPPPPARRPPLPRRLHRRAARFSRAQPLTTVTTGHRPLGSDPGSGSRMTLGPGGARVRDAQRERKPGHRRP